MIIKNFHRTTRFNSIIASLKISVLSFVKGSPHSWEIFSHSGVWLIILIEMPTLPHQLHSFVRDWKSKTMAVFVFKISKIQTWSVVMAPIHLKGGNMSVLFKSFYLIYRLTVREKLQFKYWGLRQMLGDNFLTGLWKGFGPLQWWNNPSKHEA